MISTCLRTAKLSVASIRPMRRRSARPGCGHSFSGTTKVAAQRTAMLRPESRDGSLRQELAARLKRKAPLGEA
jgi:hypothetical protein